MLLLMATVTFAQKRNFTTLVNLGSNNQIVSQTTIKLSIEYDSKLDLVTVIDENGTIFYDVTKITERRTVSGSRFTEYELHSINLSTKEKINYQIFEDKQYGVRMYIYTCYTCADFYVFQLFED